jgi:hypothetical protein
MNLHEMFVEAEQNLRQIRLRDDISPTEFVDASEMLHNVFTKLRELNDRPKGEPIPEKLAALARIAGQTKTP